MQRSAKGLLTVESDVPYSASIVAWLRLHNLPLEAIVRPSRWYERSFLAWEAVRRVRNPYFREGSGFEGYFIGRCCDADEMIAHLIDIGQTMIDSQRRFYRAGSAFHRRLARALDSNLADLDALLSWAALFGATLGRLRCAALRVAEAATFQSETYRMTNALPPIRYTVCDGRIHQTYTLPYPRQSHDRKIDLDERLLAPCDRPAVHLIWSIGKLGHPLVRQYLAAISRAWRPQ